MWSDDYVKRMEEDDRRRNEEYEKQKEERKRRDEEYEREQEERKERLEEDYRRQKEEEEKRREAENRAFNERYEWVNRSPGFLDEICGQTGHWSCNGGFYKERDDYNSNTFYTGSQYLRTWNNDTGKF